MFTQEILIERGWSKKLIEDILGIADETAPSTLYRTIKPMKLYERTSVEAAERNPRFIAHQFRYYKFSTSATAAAKNQWQGNLNEDEAINVYVKHWSTSKLCHAVSREWEQRNKIPRGCSLIEDIGDSQITQLSVDFIRNNLCYTGVNLVRLPVPIDVDKVNAPLEHKIYATIAEAYPKLSAEVFRQVEHLFGHIAAKRSGMTAGMALSLPEFSTRSSYSSSALARFREETRQLPTTTEAERVIVQRIGQKMFREMQMHFWSGQCSITGIDQPELLRASHMKPWACATDAERLNLHNGLLLSVHWDAALDGGLVTFEDDGTVLLSRRLTSSARQLLLRKTQPKICVRGFEPAHLPYFQYHRKHVWHP